MICVDYGLPWPRPVAADAAASALWQGSGQADTAAAAGWGAAQRRQLTVSGRWSASGVQDVALVAGWHWTHPVDRLSAYPWRPIPAKDGLVVERWAPVRYQRHMHVIVSYNPLPAWKDRGIAPTYHRTDEFGPRHDVALEVERSLYRPSVPLAFFFGGARYTPGTAPAVFFNFRFVPAVRRIQPVDSGTALRWGQATERNRVASLRWGQGRVLDGAITGVDYGDYDGPVTVIVPPPAEPDILETYMIYNTWTLVTLPDRVPVDARSVTLSLDADSWCWSMSAEIIGRTSLNLLRPTATGAVDVELTINGHVWVLMIERYTGSGKLADERYTVTGVSRTQLLGEPYAPRRSAVNAAPINAVQAVEAQLEYTGFTLTWDSITAGPPDWTLPPGAFSYADQTAKQVISGLVEAVGGIVRPGQSADALTVLPRYRVPVWQWGSEVMDKIIPAAIVSDWGSEWRPQPEWNSCYVSGSNAGVAAMVRRAGTAGNDPAPDVIHDWLTGALANRHRGLTELCKGGPQEIVTLNLPLFPEDTAPGLVLPGQLCEVRDIDATWRGLCLSTSIRVEGAGAARIKQSLQLERHHREGA